MAKAADTWHMIALEAALVGIECRERSRCRMHVYQGTEDKSKGGRRNDTYKRREIFLVMPAV